MKTTREYVPLLGFIDILFNFVISFTFLYLLSSLLMNIQQSKTTPQVEREGKYVIIATWNPGVNADVDLWVKAPNDEAAGFLNRDTNTLSLLRDDLGNTNDYISTEGGPPVLNPLNREEVTIRTSLVGKYIVNLHYFRSPSDYDGDINVAVELKRTKDNASLLKRDLILKARGDELTAFLFVLDNTMNDVAESEYPDIPMPWVVNRSFAGSN